MESKIKKDSSHLLASVYLVSVWGKSNLKFENFKHKWLRLTANTASISSTVQ